MSVGMLYGYLMVDGGACPAVTADLPQSANLSRALHRMPLQLGVSNFTPRHFNVRISFKARSLRKFG